MGLVMGCLCLGRTRDHTLVADNQVGSDHMGDHVDFSLPSYKPNCSPVLVAEVKLYVWYGETNCIKTTSYMT